MHQSKNSIATNYIKKKDLTHITPFDSYNSLTKQRNPAAQTYLTSSRKKSNRSFLDLEQRQNVNNHICLQHSLPVAFVCFKCNFSLICSQCSKDSHLSQPQHDIRSLEKSSIFVKNNLIKSQIRLESKSNLLTKINEQIKQKKIELFTEKNDYKQQLQKTFDYIHQLLNQKLRQMSDEIEEIYLQNDKKLADTLSQIKSLQDYLDKCQQSINHWLQSTTQSKNDFPLCTFYSQKKDVLEDIVKQSELQQFQKQIYELKYKIQTSQINSIISLLNDLEVKYDIKQIYSSSIEEAKQSKPSSLSKNMISKVKSENELKIKPSKKKFKKPIRYLDLQKTEKISFPDTRLQKPRQSHKINGTFCTSTPKEGVSRQKKLQFFKKSPDCLTFMLKKRKKSVGKMISMPASPAKDQKQERFSPSNKVKDFLFEGMKKKTTITKKKK